MGELIVSGHRALDLIQYVTTNDVSLLDVGDAQYTLMCDENGGIVDDLIVYRMEPQEYMLVVNAANIESDLMWILDHNGAGASVEDISPETGLVAVQGPHSAQLMQLFTNEDIRAFRRFTIWSGTIGGIDVWVARTGYTGEDGFECLCSARRISALWETIMDAGLAFGAEPAGLGARDVLRLEAAYPLYGNELTRAVTPVHAGLRWVVKPSKSDFIGRQAILEALRKGEGPSLVGLESVDRCIPRHGNEVKAGERIVGEVTSGTFSPTVGKGIALAYVEREYAKPGSRLDTVMGGRACLCELVTTPFYRPRASAAA